MAGSFYTPEEAAQKLGKSVDELGMLVREGKLREFRDGANVRYKAEDVDALGGPAMDEGSSIVLEPAEDDSSIVLAASGSDVLSLDQLEGEDDAGGTHAAGADELDLAPAAEEAPAPAKKKEDTVVSSVGMSVFDDDELDEVVDPLAQTAVSDVAGLGVEGVGSGSGILDLTRESDDTSLGAEFLEEVYSGDEEEAAEEEGSKTRAGLEAAAGAEEVFEAEVEEAGTAAAAPVRTAPVRAVETTDAFSSAITALTVVATVVLAFGGLAAAGLVRGVTPGVIEVVYKNLLIFGGGSVLVAIIAAAVTFFLARR